MKSKLKFRVREWSTERYGKAPLVTTQVFDTYDEARKIANKTGGLVEPHFEHQRIGTYSLPDFESGQNDIDQSKLKTKRVKKK